VDTFQIIVAIFSGIFGAGGIASLIRVRRSNRAGLPSDEGEARQLLPGVNYLTDYYQRELDALRGDLRRELAEVKKQVTRLTEERQADAEYIDDLENHIWLQKAPPPPPRRKRPESSPS
jgi:hypothetical protein